MATKFDLELLGVIENMSGFTTPDGERFTIFGEGGGQLLADELDIPLLGKVPLSEPLREHADDGTPLVTAEPDSPASQAIRQAARGIVAATPQELPGPAGAPAPPKRRRSAARRCPSSSRPAKRAAGGDPRAARAGPRFALVVVRVDLGVFGPLGRQLVLGEAGVDRAGLDAGVAVDALVRVDVEHLDRVVVGLVRRRVDAVDGQTSTHELSLLPMQARR